LPRLPITLFADFTCAACYLTEAALWRRAREGGVTLHCRAAELEGEEAQALPDTGKAHEAAKLAREAAAEEEMRRAIYRAYWEEGADIGRIDVLQALAPEAGLDPFDVKVALDIDRFRDEVLHDREVARRLGIRRGPVLYLGTGPGARILIGALSPEEIETAITNYELQITSDRNP
jgi:predicted DsbA family dithiol-disulfide isomerase